MKPVVAIVGRPNVGKSSLFNRIIGRMKAIVDDMPGVTRDLNYEPFEWNRRTFVLVDTGGWTDNPEHFIDASVSRRVQDALQGADLVVFVTDGRDGVTGMDREFSTVLRKSNKPVIVAVNKVDNPTDETPVYPFYELGFQTVIGVAATHGTGVGDLLDAVVENLPPPSEELDTLDEKAIRVAIIGRPNLGKSTLLNQLVGQYRSIVSDVPGTTRDAIDTSILFEGEPFILVDTAGMRRKAKIKDATEHYSLMRAKEAVWRSEVVLLLIDAVEGPTESDARIFSLIEETGRAAILIVNKWDAVEKETGTLEAFEREVREKYSFLHFAPVLFVSALTGKRCEKILPLVKQVREEWLKRVPTGELNRMMAEILANNPPPSSRGKQLKIYYATQIKTGPPTFALFVSRPENMPEAYERYIVNRLYETFGFMGAPIRLNVRRSGGEKDS